MEKGKGFTLIELLVVLAIIALLMAILMPVLSKVKQQAKTTVCQSNLRQWGLILDLYTNNNDNRFFRGMLDGWWNDWIEILQPFYGNKVGGLTCCPMATKTRAKGGQGIFAAWEDQEGDYGSYGLNAWLTNADKGSLFGDELYWRSPDVKGALNVPVFLDCLGITGWPTDISVPPTVRAELPTSIAQEEQMKNFCIDRHGPGKTNCLFMDWSVQKITLRQLWQLKWHRKFNVNGPWTKAGGVTPDKWPQWMSSFLAIGH